MRRFGLQSLDGIEDAHELLAERGEPVFDAHSVDNVSFRYLPAFIYPITATLKPFLAKKGHSAAEVDAMHQAWLKSVILQVTLWSYPYVKVEDF